MQSKFITLVLILATCFGAAAQSPQPRHVSLYCHRTANKDVPENTLASLRQAALFGCDVVEVDVRRTMDGKLVLNHDGMLERLTDGIGEVETSYADELELLDAGSWMGNRFAGLKIPSLESALNLARESNLKLFLDLKDEGLGPDILSILREDNMLADARFAGEPDNVKRAHPLPIMDDAEWAEPGVTSEQIKAIHAKNKLVVVNFSESGHDMDLAAMKAAVTAGADAINVDYPRLGADAVGRPVEAHIADLISTASAGDAQVRAKAIITLGDFYNFNFKSEMLNWLLDPDDRVSRAAAVVLVRSNPKPKIAELLPALHSSQPVPRANAVWSLGYLDAPASLITPLLHDTDEQVLQQALSTLAHLPGEVSLQDLTHLLQHKSPAIRGTAALALARHHPTAAAALITGQLQHEIAYMSAMHTDWEHRGRPALTDAEKRHIVTYYRCEMQEVKALSLLHSEVATRTLEQQAFRPGKDFSAMSGVLSALELWDRIGADPEPAIDALSSKDPVVADHAEWALIQAGPAVLPVICKTLAEQSGSIRERIIRILAFQGDVASLDALQTLPHTDPSQQQLTNWAIAKICMLHPEAPACTAARATPKH